MASDPEHDTFLHAIRTSPLEPRERDIRNFHYWHDRIVVLKQVFDEAPGTNSLAQLWHDRRNSRQWYTFWSVLLFGLLAVSLGFAEVVLASIQLRNFNHAYTVYTGDAGGPSFNEAPFMATTSTSALTSPKVGERIINNVSPEFTTSSSKATTSPTSAFGSTSPKFEDSFNHNMSPWEIAGITIGGGTVLITVLGVSLFLFQRRVRQRLQQRDLLRIRQREEFEEAYRRQSIYSPKEKQPLEI